MTVVINNSYRFTSDKQDQITEDDIFAGVVSEPIFDAFEEWPALDGTIVEVLAIHTSKNKHGCAEPLAKVYIKGEGTHYWFTTKVSNLTAINPTSNNGKNQCSCAMSLILIRGCQCGGI